MLLPSSPQPAHQTKHIRTLVYPFSGSLFQLSQLDNGLSNGTALWLGAQCLSSYLRFISRSYPGGERPKVIELGSGVGLTA
jgi:protein N-lysine methyltransferase METTL21D